ncbi:diguanylate cyclase/phosphodiesterase [Pseudomonas sp. M47T1]|uniref:bifunctional diguanylate cyclase/phosphodiesterase n=1 Tax=unclassified Pseudomonas TaxID=196821 RepID=UPI0002606B05|nr:EAL domain-containing protein [Pseudomonas sp. M47T1]EIK98281.1 diguanylate cyclase/phosphodiesterase [Pseudomonas sp. M47T1]
MDITHAASRHPVFTRKLLSVLACLFALTLLAAMAMLVQIANGLNADQQQQTLFYAQKALETRQANSASLVTSYAVWNTAFQHLDGAVDVQWAYSQRNLGPPLYTQNGYEAVFVVNSHSTKYSLYLGQLSNAEIGDFISTPLRPLVQQAQAATSGATAVSQVALFNGWPALVSASPILPDDDSTQPAPADTSVLLLVDLLTPAKLQALGNGYGLQNLAIQSHTTGAPGQPRLALGHSGYDLTWSAPQPGNQLLWQVLPTLVAAFVVLALLMAWFFRYALRTARQIEEGYGRLHQTNRALEASEERFRAVAEAASDWIWETDEHCRLNYLSGRFAVVTGYTSQDWVNHTIDQLLQCETTPLQGWLHSLPRTPSASSLRCAYRDQAGQLRYCRLSARPILFEGQVVGYRGTASDITDEVAAHAQIQHLSMHDALTGLANRNQLCHYFEQLRLQPRPPPLTLIVLDLDSFKPINDSLGHPAGDAVLLEVAARLRECTRAKDLVARLGGDEFVLVLCGLDSREEIDRFCARLIDSLHQPIDYPLQPLHVGASLGIAQSLKQGLDATELVRCAELALYQAKADGKNTWRYFSPHMHEQIQYRRQLEHDLRLAVKNQEFVLHYQPRYRLTTMEIVSVEALVRWQHPIHGLLQPDTFIPLAEQTGLIVQLGRWVLREACDAARLWPETLVVSVNLSAAQFSRNDVVRDVRDVLVQTRLPAQRLELEVTENVMMNDIDNALGTLTALKELGVKLNMDDFGTGYSSLGYLRTYPFDSLKIDKRFIAALESTDRDRAVVQAIINLGKAMGLTVTAEGVENEQQLQTLSNNHCHEVQGYFMSRPLDRQALTRLLGNNNAQKTALPSPALP